MTAYELADELKSCIDDGSTDLVCVCGAVNMLRQQADRIKELEADVNKKLVMIGLWEVKYKEQADCIAELEKENFNLDQKIAELNGQLLISTNAEPVAWATEDLEEIMTPELRQAHIDHPKSCTHKFFPIPLYTTPQTKPLSDEEIEQIAVKWYIGTRILPIGFARAIEERHGIK